ncbi:MAG TPA: serine hydrolase domain-containing protein [Rubrobacteraceae bacterium]|nr:serine hydrolase domain-containing protein [Rubrobacteraceae bacterium]
MRGRVPGLSVAVVHPKGVVWKKGFGIADLGSGSPAAPETIYPWFSMTKIVTATAVAQLADRGLLSLEDPVSLHYPPFAELRPTHHAERVTIRHLLNHSAGLANPLPITWVHPADRPAPDQRAFVRGVLEKHPRLRFSPGAKGSYSNVGYLVLGEIVGSASGRPYPEYVRENILEPLGMRHTSFVYVGDASKGSFATGYQLRRSPMTWLMKLMLPDGILDGTEGRFVAFNRFYVDGAAYGGLVGPVSDAARFLQAHLAGGELEGKRILSEATAARMRSTLVSGGKRDFGLGWYRPREARNMRPGFVEHLGGGGGFWNCMRLYPDVPSGIVTMGNATRYDHEVIIGLLGKRRGLAR